MMTAIAYSLVLLICGPNTGCTEVLYGEGLSHIECLIEGAKAVQDGLGDDFRCRYTQGQKA